MIKPIQISDVNFSGKGVKPKNLKRVIKQGLPKGLSQYMPKIKVDKDDATGMAIGSGMFSGSAATSAIYSFFTSYS